jgi:hypothetical protein
MRQQQLAAERRFFSAFAFVILITVFVGFSRSFFLKPVLFPDHPAPSEPIFIIHGLFFSAWIVLLSLQAKLVANGNVQFHRKLGAWGAALAASLVVLGTYAGLIAAHRPGGFIGVPIPPLSFLIVPLAGVLQFGIFVALAIARRADVQAHKRLMLIGSLQMVTPAIARWPVLSTMGPLAFFGLTDVFIIALAIFDFRTRGKLHPVTLWGGIITIAAQPVQLAISGTAPWLDFARWATGLLG